MNEGWLTSFTLYREDSVLGDPVGTLLRPPGLREAAFNAVVTKKFERQTAWGLQKGQDTVHQYWTLTLSRQTGVDTLFTFWLEALRTGTLSTAPGTPSAGWQTVTRPTNGTGATPSFGADIGLPDGTFRRLSGMTPNKIELLIERGRAVTEEVTFIVCRNDEIEAGEFIEGTQILHEIAPAVRAMHALQLGFGSFPNPVPSRVTTFSSQLIFTRDVLPVQYGLDGMASRLEASGSWELTGKSLVQARAGELDSFLGGARACKLWWRIRHPYDATRLVEITAPACMAKVNGQFAVAHDFIDNQLDWMATDDGLGVFSTMEIVPS